MTDTPRMRKPSKAWWYVIALSLGLLGAPTHASPPAPPDAPTLDLGIPSGALGATILGECLRRDRTLDTDLAEAGLRLTLHPLPTDRGGLPRLDDTGLEAGFLDEMAAISAAATGDGVLIALVHQGFTSVIAQAPLRLAELRGRRIALAPGPGARFTLFQALRSAGIAVDEVGLTPMETQAMPQALAEGRVDLLVAGEPTATLALSGLPGARVVWRGLGTSFFVHSRGLATTHPEAARALDVSLLRALQWLKRGSRNQEMAARWALDGGGLGGISLWQATSLLRREVLDVAGAPFIPYRYQEAGGPLEDGLRLLQASGALPPDLEWGRIRASLDSESLHTALRLGPHVKLRVYDYAAEPLSR